MEAALSTNLESDHETRPAAVLKGSARGLDLLIDARAALDDVEAAITAKLAEAPEFFRGNDVRVRVEAGPLAAGSLARLDAITARYELRIVEIGAAGAKAKRELERPAGDAVPVAPVQLAAGSAPAAVVGASEPAEPAEPPPADALAMAIGTAATALVPHADDTAANSADLAPLLDALRTLEATAWITEPPTTRRAPFPEAADEPGMQLPAEPAYASIRAVIGPIRSGVILDHRGHVVIFGDVNPGAEVRAEGNIIVLGRLRGIAHAGIGRDGGFILALRLEPQQLRISRMVARAADSDAGSREPELAHITNGSITVERYQGRLPGNLAASI
jgi:septum site-determining protein MinC